MEDFPIPVAERSAPKYGFFGKLPSVGDFVSRGLDRSRIEAVDGWFQRGLGALQQSDTDWLSAYLVAPVWCFAVPAGLWGEQACGGALMASVDRVGRYFPLMVLADLDDDLAKDHPRLCAHLRALSQFLPSALRDLPSPDAFAEQLNELAWRSPDIPPSRPTVLERFQPQGNGSAWWAVLRHDRPFLQISHRGAPDAELFGQLFAAWVEQG